jgi:FixJ family two-component response regulator
MSRKPVILLVDDDAAVLESLEAGLTPSLEEICRIEAFRDPREVLDAAVRWEAERRPIAAAVVDQRMPHLTGVELLGRLREVGAEFKPAAGCQSILLTGYAGLEAAVRAKNDGGVVRYLEKPWTPGELERTVARLVTKYLLDAGMLTYSLFRESESAEELQELMRLRYAVFRLEPRLQAFVKENAAGIDLDAYDPNSRHLGLFRIDSRESGCVGYIRIVTEHAENQAARVREIAARHPQAEDPLASEPRSLPFMAYWPDRDAVLSIVDEAARRGQSLTEASRLSVSPEFREKATVEFFLDAVVSGWLALGYRIYFACCRVAHRRAWGPRGFGEVPGTTVHDLPGVGKSCCLVLTRDAETTVVPPRLVEQAARYERTSDLCHCGTYPECFPEHYRTTDFGATDLFCPRRAERLARGPEATRSLAGSEQDPLPPRRVP